MRRYKFAPSLTYGQPHPSLYKAKKSAEFIQSIYDAAPAYIRRQVQREKSGEGTQAMLEWFYSCQHDPRPEGQRLKATPDYDLPPFPWDPNRPMTLFDIFG